MTISWGVLLSIKKGTKGTPGFSRATLWGLSQTDWNPDSQFSEDLGGLAAFPGFQDAFFSRSFLIRHFLKHVAHFFDVLVFFIDKKKQKLRKWAFLVSGNLFNDFDLVSDLLPTHRTGNYPGPFAVSRWGATPPPPGPPMHPSPSPWGGSISACRPWLRDSGLLIQIFVWKPLEPQGLLRWGWGPGGGAGHEAERGREVPPQHDRHPGVEGGGGADEQGPHPVQRPALHGPYGRFGGGGRGDAAPWIMWEFWKESGLFNSWEWMSAFFPFWVWRHCEVEACIPLQRYFSLPFPNSSIRAVFVATDFVSSADLASQQQVFDLPRLIAAYNGVFWCVYWISWQEHHSFHAFLFTPILNDWV